MPQYIPSYMECTIAPRYTEYGIIREKIMVIFVLKKK